MAIRQKTFQIYTRPSIIIADPDPKKPDTVIILSQKTDLYMTNPTTNKEEKVIIPEDSGGTWVKVFESTSYELIRSRVKQLLPSCPANAIKVVKQIPTDIDVIPQV